MDQKTLNNSRFSRYEKIIEASTWIVVIIVLFGIRFLPQDLIDNDQAYYLIGAIVSFALLYYLVVYKYFPRSKRLYVKDIADIILIGVLIHIVKDYGQYFFALYFLPIAAAALSLEFFNALLIAMIASVFVVFEIVLGSQKLLPQVNEFYQGAWQIGLILFITIFCRALAIQLRQEKSAHEESLARQKALEEEAERNKEFLSLTSHQLFTPLSMIRGFSSMLNDENLGKLNPKQKDAAGEIYANTIRMVNLVAELMSISRIQSGNFVPKKHPSDIGKLLKSIVSQFQKSLPKNGISLSLEIPELKDINIDSEKIRDCLYNLIGNAIKYTKKGKITVSSSQDETQTTIKISDEGVGIKQEDFSKLFQPFFRGKNILELDNQGTGLGLYISRLIVERHGGKIWSENNADGKGATFAFYLPNN
ncbi:MAG: Sensor protein resE [Candidatus Berkelbacteria bacterium]|nr:Sensor protein resE [Candidatus Berkelbacteria bacterium]